MKKTTKYSLLTAAAISVTTIAGLIYHGKRNGKGPFQSLKDYPKDIENITKNYPLTRNGEIVFYGASNFTYWQQMENDIPAYKVQNHGFGGSTDKLLIKHAQELLFDYDPNIVFIQTGSNDYVNLSGSDEKKVQKCIEIKKAMYEYFHDNLPDTKFVIMSGLLLPKRSEFVNLTNMINSQLKQICEEYDYLYFVDASEMTYQNGIFKEELFKEDGIHLNHDGQLKWCNDYIIPMIDHLVEKYQLYDLKK